MLAAGSAAVRTVGRSVPPAIGAVMVLAAMPAIIVAARGGADFDGALIAASIIVGAGAGYAVDDPAAATLAASPTTLAARRSLRGAVIVVALALAWVMAVGLAGRFGAGRPDLSDLAATMAAAAAISLALAARARTDAAVSSGSAAGSGALLAMVVVASLSMRWSQLPTLDPGPSHGRWWWVAAAGLASAAWSSRDPAGRAGAMRVPRRRHRSALP